MTDTHTKLIPLTIDRRTWLRGEGPDLSYLLRPADRKMCCLGAAALAAGATTEDILGTRNPPQVGNSKGRFPVPALCVPIANCYDLDGNELASTFVLQAMELNDHLNLPDAEREAALIPVLAKLGFAAEFVN